MVHEFYLNFKKKEKEKDVKIHYNYDYISYLTMLEHSLEIFIICTVLCCLTLLHPIGNFFIGFSVYKTMYMHCLKL